MFPVPGGHLSHFRLEEKIGAGGMGVVYRARDEHLMRDVAVKVLKPGLIAAESARSRFRKEALALSRLSHPNIAAVYDFDAQEAVDYLVMEYVPGISLSNKLSEGPLEERELVQLGLQLGEALSAAHEREIVHRDLKPDNVRLTEDGRLKVLDFGLAKLVKPAGESATTETQTRGIVGTVPYMAPEQFREGPVDARTDVYAAGNLLYEMATGRRPHSESDTARLIYVIAHETPPPPRRSNPRISPALDAVIRKALEKDPEMRYQTAREMVDDLRRLEAGMPVTAPRPRAGRGSRWGLGLAVAAVVLLAALLGIEMSGLRERLLGGADRTRITSLAVLPLDNLSGDPEKEYFAEAMTEELSIDLGKIGTLTVIGRQSVRRFKDSNETLQEIAGKLGVQALVVGSVAPVGDRVRITARLVQASTERQLWAERYERDLRDVLVVQGEIARAIARRIEAVLTPEQEALFERVARVDPAAHEAYLKGKFHLARFSPDDTAKALEYLQQAVEQDSDYAAAHASLGYAYFLAGHSFGLVPFGEGMAKSKAASLRAIEIDESTAEAYSYLGYVEHFHEYDWPAAEAAYRKAVEVNPSFSYGHSTYAFFLSTMGRHDAALEQARRAVELDPVSLSARVHLAEMFYHARRFDETLEECQRIIDLDPTFTRTYKFTRLVYEQRKMYPEAIDATRRSQQYLGLGTEFVDGVRRAYERDGETGYWQARLENQLELYGDTAGKQYYIATHYAALGDKDRAFAYLERSYDNREVGLVFVNVQPIMDPLRSDPRFDELIRRIGFPPADQRQQTLGSFNKKERRWICLSSGPYSRGVASSTSQSWCCGFSASQPLMILSTGSTARGSSSPWRSSMRFTTREWRS